MNNVNCFPFFGPLPWAPKIISHRTREKLTSCDANAMSNWASSSDQTPRSKEAGCGLTFPASDLPLSLPLLLPSLPLVASPCRAGSAHLQPRIETSTASWPHLIARLLSRPQEGKGQFCFSMNSMSLALGKSKDPLLWKLCKAKICHWCTFFSSK